MNIELRKENNEGGLIHYCPDLTWVIHGKKELSFLLSTFSHIWWTLAFSLSEILTQMPKLQVCFNLLLYNNSRAFDMFTSCVKFLDYGGPKLLLNLRTFELFNNLR